MFFKNDGHGLKLEVKDIEEFYVCGPNHTWQMKLAGLADTKGMVRIITYNFSNVKMVKEILGKRPNNIQVIGHNMFFKQDTPQRLADVLPGIEFRVNDHVHSKVCLIEPDIVFLGSENFSYSGWHESMIGIRSSKAYDYYLENMFQPLWNESTPLISCPKVTIPKTTLLSLPVKEYFDSALELLGVGSRKEALNLRKFVRIEAVKATCGLNLITAMKYMGLFDDFTDEEFEEVEKIADSLELQQYSGIFCISRWRRGSKVFSPPEEQERCVGIVKLWYEEEMLWQEPGYENVECSGLKDIVFKERSFCEWYYRNQDNIPGQLTYDRASSYFKKVFTDQVEFDRVLGSLIS